MTAPDVAFEEVLRSYAVALTRKYQAQVKGQPEDQLKGPVQDVLEAFGKLLGLDVVAKTESPVAEVGRPDVAVGVGGPTTGYVELKAPGEGALPSQYKGRDRAQWTRFQGLLNLI